MNGCSKLTGSRASRVVLADGGVASSKLSGRRPPIVTATSTCEVVCASARNASKSSSKIKKNESVEENVC